MANIRRRLLTIAIGLAITALVAAAFHSRLEYLVLVEAKALDVRFRWLSTLELSDSICLVGFDDETLVRMGYPLRRDLLGQVLTTLDELGAEQLVIDLTFTTHREDPSEDHALAEAIAATDSTILSLYFVEQPGGSAIRQVLEDDFTLTIADVADRLGMTPASVKRRFAAAKRQAAQALVKRAVRENPEATPIQIAQAILGADAALRLTSDRREIVDAYRRLQALDIARSFGRRVTMQYPVRTDLTLTPPIAVLGASAADIGFVSFDTDLDGTVRHLSPLVVHDDRAYVQLGACAAIHHLGIDGGAMYTDRHDLCLSAGTTSAGTSSTLRRVPLDEHGRVLINWPANVEGKSWLDVFEHTVSVAAIAQIPQYRREILQNEQMLAQAPALAVRHYLPYRWDEYLQLRDRLEQLPQDTPAATTSPATSPATAAANDASERADVIRSIDAIEHAAREEALFQYEDAVGMEPATSEEEQQLRTIRTLYQCLYEPDQIRHINDSMRESVEQITDILREHVAGRVCFVGYTATTLADMRSTPVYAQCPGVAIHAAMYNNMVQNRFIRPTPLHNDVLLVLVCGTIVTLFTAFRGPWISFMFMVLLVGTLLFVNVVVLFQQSGVYSAIVAPLAAVFVSWAMVTLYRQVTEGRTRRAFEGRLSQYTSPAIARRISEDPRQMELRSEQYEVTCFFSDIKGFTPVSEQLGAQRCVQLLNIYLERMSAALDRHEAFINKFQGDGIFAFFNPPLNPQKDHARRACLAAVECVNELETLVVQEHWQQLGFPYLQMRIGLNTGIAVVGDCGSNRKFDYTCIGDTVNLAARLEPANKFFGTSILASQATYDAAGRCVPARRIGRIQVVGRDEPVQVVSLLTRHENVDDDSLREQWLAAFAAGTQALEAGDFAQSHMHFIEAGRLNPQDPAAQKLADYARTLSELRPAEWSGVIEMTEK